MAADLDIIATMRMADGQAFNHLFPVATHPRVRKLWIVRATPPRGHLPNTELLLVSNRTVVDRLVSMTRHARRIVGEPGRHAFVTFNPLPYSLPAWLARGNRRVPLHVGFVGTDWNARAKRAPRELVGACLRRADFVTVLNTTMRGEVVSRGVSPDRVAVLPPGFDVASFEAPDDAERPFAAAFVGRLIENKRVPLILEAWARVGVTHPTARLVVVGDGPLRGALEARARRLGIAERVTFVGHQHDVRPYLWKSRALLVTSDAEGIPWVVVEGMAAGAVPVARSIGAIPENVEDGENGLLVEDDHPLSLAARVTSFLDQPGRERAMRLAARAHARTLTFERTRRVWDLWFSRL